MISEKLGSLFKKIGAKSIEMAEKLENTATQDEFESKIKKSQEKGDTKYTDVKKFIESETLSIEFDKSREISKANPEYSKLNKSQGLFALLNLLLLALSVGLMLYSFKFLASKDLAKFIMVSAVGMLTLFFEHRNVLKLKERREKIERIEKEPFEFSDDIKAREEKLSEMKQKLDGLLQETIVEENINVSKEMREVRENIESFKKTSKIIEVIMKIVFYIPMLYAFCIDNYKMLVINAVAYLVISIIIFIYKDSQVDKMEKELKDLENQYH